MSKKLGLVLLVILGLFLATLMSRNAALAWMTLPFLSYLAAGILTSPQQVRLSISRTVSHLRCEAGTPITMTVIIENNGPAVPYLRIQESFEPKIRLIGSLDEPSRILRAGSKARLQYTFLAPRGRYYWKDTRVTVSDPFGLFEKTIELVAEADLLVLPGQASVKPPGLNPRHTIRAPGIHLSRLPGSGVDFYGVRAYHPGDPLRWIHWRLSARHPKQHYSKEFEREEMADIGLILDGSAAMNLKNGSEELFEYSIQAAAGLAQSILRAGNRLSLLALGERVVRVFPGAGKHQLVRILDTLAASQPGENVSLNTLKYLPVKLFPSHALIILVSPLRASDFSAIARLLASKYQVLVVSPDPVKFAGRGSHTSLAVRAAAVERKALLWRIGELGAQVFEWPVAQPLSIEPGNAARTTQKRVEKGHKFQPSLKTPEQTWLSPVSLVLLVFGAAAAVLSGISPAIMIAGAGLGLFFWESTGQIVYRPREGGFPSFSFPQWAYTKLLLTTVGIGLLFAEGGLQVYLTLPFGIILLAVLLILFGFSRFYRLIIR